MSSPIQFNGFTAPLVCRRGLLNVLTNYGLQDRGIGVPLPAEAEIALCPAASISALFFLLSFSLVYSIIDVPFSGALTSV
jgi:hypothetical protein